MLIVELVRGLDQVHRRTRLGGARDVLPSARAAC